MNDWETSVDKVIMANGNDLFIKNIDKVRRTFYTPEEPLELNQQISIKGRLFITIRIVVYS